MTMARKDEEEAAALKRKRSSTSAHTQSESSILQFDTGSSSGSEEESRNQNNVEESTHKFLTDQAREEILAFIQREVNEDKPKEEEGNLLPKDTFSFFVFTRLVSPAFFMSFVVLVFQFGLLAAITFDLLFSGDQDSSNKLGVPAFIPWAVRLVQALTLLIVVVSNMDVLWSINLLYKGFDKAAFLECLQQDHDGSMNSNTTSDEESAGPKEAHYPHLGKRWYVSVLLRLLFGIYCLGVTFMLIMRAETTRTVLLSYGAINLIASLSKIIFGLASWGYFGTQIKSTADHALIGDVDFSTKPSEDDESRAALWKKPNVWRVLTVTVIWLVLEGFWLWMTFKQINGDYLTQSVYVQFGDDEVSTLGLLSGIYDVNVWHSDVDYTARPFASDSSSSFKGYIRSDPTVNQFRFCREGKFWSLGARNRDSAVIGKNSGACNDWLLRSAAIDTNRYNIFSAASTRWVVPTPSDGRKGSVELKSLIMLRREEECSDGRFGPVCEFAQPCESLAIDGDAFQMDISWSVYGIDVDENNEIQEPFYALLDLDNSTAHKRYSILKKNGRMVLARDRPAYYASIAIQSDDYSAYEVICNLGRRWARVIIGIEGTDRTTHAVRALADKVLLLGESVKRAEGVAISFRYVTHLSESFDIGTLGDSGIPIGLQWYRASDSEAFKANVELQVADVLRCECPICPDRISAIPEANFNNSVQVDFGSSALYGQNVTCGELVEMAGDTTIGSYTCTSVQMASMFECGCPFVELEDTPCPLCSNGLDSIILDKIPFPGGGGFAGAGGNLSDTSCAELSWGSNLRAEFEMRDNPNWCPTWQAIYGTACGCSNLPPPLRCKVSCPSEQDFDQLRVVEIYERDERLNGWYCGEILGVLNFLDGVCSEEAKQALAELCCVAV